MRASYLLLAAAVWPAVAQETLPAGAAILDKYIEVTGGKAAYEKLRTEVRNAAMEIAGSGMRFAVTIYRAAPSKSYMSMEMPGVGKIEEGTDGTVVWNISAMQGPQVKEGDERALSLLGAAFNGDLRWRDLFKSAETTGVEDVEGKSCYKVVVTSNEGLKQTRYYDRKTGLLAKTDMTVKTQMGEIPTQVTVSDYRDANGILTPFKAVTSLMSQQLVMTVESVKHNVAIEDSRFAIPDQIQALLKKDKKD